MTEGPPSDDGDATAVLPTEGEGAATVAEPAASRAMRAAFPAAEPVSPVGVGSGSSVAPGVETGASSLTSATRSGATTIASPMEALERDELLRTRRFCVIAAGLVVAGGVAVPLLPGDPVASVMLLCAVAIALVGIAFLYPRTADPMRFRAPITGLGFFLPTAAVTAAIPFFGAFSPAPVLVILAVYFTGLGASGRVAAAVYVTCAVGQAVTAGLVILGVTRDTGLVQVGFLTSRSQWMIQALVQIVMFGTYLTARLSRRTALLAVGELERAVRTAAHREALLLEAREELERALRAGRGRFTEQMIGGYQLGEVIGRGAMGEVYAAVDSRTERPVAIKLLSQASLGNPQHVQRFLRELTTAASIKSPYVVEVIEAGERPVPFLVMERLEGKSLSDILRGKRGFASDKVVELVRHIAAGLDQAAAAGVVHRDVKPQNLFLHKRTWKILDFGVSRLAEHGDTLTAGQVIGTPSYMSPEQARGGTVDHRTDLYALAAVAYRALTGQPPFAAGEIAETLYRVVHTAPRRPSQLAKLAAEVDLVLAIGLAKDPAHRFARASELAECLAQAFAGSLPNALAARGRALEQRGAWADRPR